jgi:predicted NBD/HSP70 family sugar kinase
MYLAIDVGGTKTLLAVFNEDGNIIASHKIATNREYPKFLNDIQQIISSELSSYQITHCCCALPGTIDFKNGIAIAFGNENWQNVPVRKDIQLLLPDVKILIHNDAKLAFG